MVSRLEQLLTAENISKSQFSEILGVSPATVSHLLSGRNKPSYEILVAISKNFPNLNIDWLLNGTGKMYKNDDSTDSPATDTTLFGAFNESNTLNNRVQGDINKPKAIEKHISKILIFYSDGTFQDIQVK